MDTYVRYGCGYGIISKVYAVDTIRHEFLIVVDDDFKWVKIYDCKLITKGEAEGYDYD